MTIEASKKLLQKARGDFAAWKKEIAELQRITVVATSWYPEVIEGLSASADEFFAAMDIPPAKITKLRVSGSWELPLAVKTAIEKHKSDLVVTLGCVIKGETPHFDILCQAVAGELLRLQSETATPVGFGVLTVNNLEQAKARPDKGAEAAEAALRSWIQLRKI